MFLRASRRKISIKKKGISNKRYNENVDVPFIVLIYWTVGNEDTRTDHSCISQIMQCL